MFDADLFIVTIEIAARLCSETRSYIVMTSIVRP